MPLVRVEHYPRQILPQAGSIELALARDGQPLRWQRLLRVDFSPLAGAPLAFGESACLEDCEFLLCYDAAGMFRAVAVPQGGRWHGHGHGLPQERPAVA